MISTFFFLCTITVRHLVLHDRLNRTVRILLTYFLKECFPVGFRIIGCCQIAISLQVVHHDVKSDCRTIFLRGPGGDSNSMLFTCVIPDCVSFSLFLVSSFEGNL